MAAVELRDKHKDNEILLENYGALNLSKEVMRMAENDPELLNSVYKEVSEKLGMDTAMDPFFMGCYFTALLLYKYFCRLYLSTQPASYGLFLQHLFHKLEYSKTIFHVKGMMVG